MGYGIYVASTMYRQKSLKIKGSQKLPSKFYGPLKILQCIVPIVYKLELSASSKVHSIFHVSYLKKVLGSHVKPQIELLEFTDDDTIKIEPKTVLE